MKTIALLTVAISFILMGQYANNKMKRRIVSLKEFILFLEYINSQITFSKKNINEIISDFVVASDMKLKTLCEVCSFDGGNFHENWKTSVLKFASSDCLTKDDVNILLSFGKNLGTTDLQGQISNLQLHCEMLKKGLVNAEENLKEKLKINTALSSISALALIIILY